MPTLTKKAFEKFGFSTATLITEWTRIAGAELAAYTIPDKLKWPRGTEAASLQDEEGERRGATLILRVDPARALDVEYRARQIIDRINAYFGYRAVEVLKLVQAPVENRSSSAAQAAPSVATAPSGPSDDPLLAALARLEKGVMRDLAKRRA